MGENIINEKVNTGITIKESINIIIMLCLYEAGMYIIFAILGEILILLGLNGVVPYTDLCAKVAAYVIAIRALQKKKNYKLRIKYNFKFIECLLVLTILIGFSLVYDNTIELLLLRIKENSWIKSVLEEKMKTPIAAFISLAVIAPILEELIFRGIILEQLSKRYSSIIAILVSAIIFAVIHLNISQGISAFLIGIILGIIYLKTKSLIPCILLHFANNFFCFLVLNSQINYEIKFSATKLIIGSIILIISLYGFQKYNKNTKKPDVGVQA